MEKENVTIDPLTPFLRLLVVVERKPENEIANYFNYELTPYPMSLFKDRKMCSTKKSALLLKNVKETDPTEAAKTIDGGALLWCCDWKRNETFEKNCECSNFLSYHPDEIIVFDRYAPSTKDANTRNKSGKFSETVKIKSNNPCNSDRSMFSSNYINKANFLNVLAEKNGFNIMQCPADTAIIKTALTIAKESLVNVFTDDTNIFSLLIHHITNNSTNMYNIYVTNVKKEQSGEC